MHRLGTASKIALAVAGMLAGAAAIAFIATGALSRADTKPPQADPLAAGPDQEAMTGAGTTSVSGDRTRRSGEPGAKRRPRERIEWSKSSAIGLPHAGRLVDGVQLPAEGRTFFTWDPIHKRKPNRRWRRWGTHVLVRTVLGVAGDFARENPGAPRIAVGDLSRPRGGDFGPQFGSIGHASHQNGLDVDIYYPLRSGRERAPLRVSEVDMRLAQDLVDRFVAAGAVKVFVGPSTPLAGPPGIVQKLVHHDNHLHVRLAP
ncbi:MAG TPA: penicillin-insensitive murein endopeptidase [Solirubrobacterales bacterium]|nr:penicillin-insensitive murein endopeptidase [Solirubrobacterales bacterium]